MNLKNFFNPQTIAVVGASSDTNKVGYAIMANLLQMEETEQHSFLIRSRDIGRAILPVSISENHILGLPAFKSLNDIPSHQKIDLAIIAVKADIVPQIVDQCGRRAIKNIIIISAGFRETGENGLNLENQIASLAKKYDLAILGPNCLGAIDMNSNFNASFGAKNALKGNIAFLSQSGALGTAVLDMAIREGIGFSKFISLGNEVQLTEIDFLEYLAEDSNTKAILIYMERLSDGPKFMELAKKISSKKPIVVLKAGRSPRGWQAVMSHTGSLAPEDSVFSAALKQSGIIAVETIGEFVNLAKLFQLNIYKPLNNLAVVTNGGGPSIVTADLIDLSQTLSLAKISESNQKALKRVLPPMAAVGNPIDIIGDALSSRYQDTLKIITADNTIQAIILILTPQMMTEARATAKIIADMCHIKPIMPVFIGGPSIEKAQNCLNKYGLVNFNFPEDAVKALDSLNDIWGCTKQETSSAGGYNNKELKQLGFVETYELLNKYEIKLAGQLIKEKKQLPEIISKLGSGPYAMKVISSDIVHKTDAGVVALNIENIEQADSAWDVIMSKANKFKSQVQIDGVHIQAMSRGREVIIGMKRDLNFGPIILFGLGGILAEAIKDTVIRITPFNKAQAQQMIEEIRGIEILKGMRGQKAVNFDLLADTIIKLQKLALENSEIKEVDLNPIILTEESTTIVDARIMV